MSSIPRQAAIGAVIAVTLMLGANASSRAGAPHYGFAGAEASLSVLRAYAGSAVVSVFDGAADLLGNLSVHLKRA